MNSPQQLPSRSPLRPRAIIRPPARPVQASTGPRPDRAPGSGRPRLARRSMSTGSGLLLIATGAILLFALTDQASPGWIDLHVVGLILMLTGLAGLVLPRISRPPAEGELRRWVVPMLPAGPGDGPETGLLRRPGDDGDGPTLADDLLRDEHDFVERDR
jgi:hypothetical protein